MTEPSAAPKPPAESSPPPATETKQQQPEKTAPAPAAPAKEEKKSQNAPAVSGQQPPQQQQKASVTQTPQKKEPEYFGQLAAINDEMDALSNELSEKLSTFKKAKDSSTLKSDVERSFAQFSGEKPKYEHSAKRQSPARAEVGGAMDYGDQDRELYIEEQLEDKYGHGRGESAGYQRQEPDVESYQQPNYEDYRRREPAKPSLYQSPPRRPLY